MNGEEDALEQYVAEFIEQLLRKTFHRCKFCNAGIGNKNVDRLKSFRSPPKQTFEILHVANIPLHRQHIASQSGGLIKRLPAASKKDHLVVSDPQGIRPGGYMS